jgi:hypothetical protein
MVNSDEAVSSCPGCAPTTPCTCVVFVAALDESYAFGLGRGHLGEMKERMALLRFEPKRGLGERTAVSVRPTSTES